MSRVASLTLAFLLLAGCGDGSPVAKEAGQGGPPASAVISEEESPAVVDRRGPGAIPASLHGLWAMSPADCARPTAGPEAFIEVRGDELRFPGMTARPTGDAKTTDRSIGGQFAFEDKEKRWTRFQSLQLRGDTLVRTQSDPMMSFTYARCR